LGLVAAGDAVHVLAPFSTGGVPTDLGVEIHPLRGGFGPRGLGQASRVLDSIQKPLRLLVQYVPHAFGLKAMNLPFCFWLRTRKKIPIDLMFHEVAYPKGGPAVRQRLLAGVQRVMARLVADAADRILVSTLSWEPVLRAIGVMRPLLHMPIPSNVPTSVERSAVADLRARLDPAASRLLIGHFGTFGGAIATELSGILARLLARDPLRLAVLVGRGSRTFVREFLQTFPELNGQAVPADGLPPGEVALHLSACDLVVQPFPDGVTTRRTSLMAGLALGVPVVSNRGSLTESFWHDADGVFLASSPDGLVSAAELLAHNPEMRRHLGERGAALYREHLSLERSIRALRVTGSSAAPFIE
jgi:hypothetical protein